MKKWLRKALVVTFTIMTFGLLTPPSALTMEQTKPDEPLKPDLIERQSPQSQTISIENLEKDSTSDFVDFAINQAEILSLEKFGKKIGPVIEDEFRSVILPRIEEVILSLSELYPYEAVNNLVITEQPTGGISEKIFHIYDKTSGKDTIRFHVRRDNPPQEGFWFNFHYHTHHDAFQAHHELGKIYWAKNTPPQWLS